MNRARFASPRFVGLVAAIALGVVACSTSSVHPEPFGDCPVSPCNYSAPSPKGGGSTTGGSKPDSGSGGTTGGSTTGGGTTGGTADSGADTGVSDAATD